MIAPLFLLACQSASDLSLRPAGFIDINKLIPEAHFDIRYFTANNFVGSQIDGYQKPKCLLQEKAAFALKRIAVNAQKRGLKLKIFDCYRPQQAVDHFVRWAADMGDQKTKSTYYPKLDKGSLIGPYIAAKSGHTRGATIDLTLTENIQGQWRELDMGGHYDFFDSISNTDDKRISKKQKKNRYILKQLMEAGGYSYYDMEWWHFSLQPQPYLDTYFNFPVN
ncbi:MAG: peptidase M15 [Gammaproteobacteria bacterium]|nr:MAG: peptidase M15 [Gammaproteobacteria bacterium]